MKSLETYEIYNEKLKRKPLASTVIVLMTSTALVFPHTLLAAELPTGANEQA